MSTIRYPCRANRAVLLTALILFVLAAGFFSSTAQANDRGLVIDALVRLGPAGATRFYWLLTALSGAMAAIGLWALAMSFLVVREVVIDPDTLTAPRMGAFGAPKTIRLADIGLL